MLHVDLTQLAGGALQEKFDREITRVIENMQDPNTPFGEKRKITIDISLQSKTEFRDDANIEISVKSKLAGVISAKTNFAMDKDLQSGQVIVKEYGKQIPGQMSFSDMSEPAEKEPEKPKIASMPRHLRANG
ncbi:hypothetical protein D3Z36_00605 [Lachnospiraceae bacterium]|nr:hypothetical protein [Lachnospiraceae bacterium]